VQLWAARIGVPAWAGISMPQWAGLPKASDSPIELSGWYALAMDKSWNRLPRAAQQFLCWFLYRTSVPTWVASQWKADDAEYPSDHP